MGVCTYTEGEIVLQFPDLKMKVLEVMPSWLHFNNGFTIRIKLN